VKTYFKLYFALIFIGYTLSAQAQTTWTGASSTSWTLAANWSAGVPDANDVVIIADVTNNPIISTTGAVAKSVTVEVGGVLTVNAGGILTINGATDQGFLNSGTVTNSGTIEIGNTSGVGLVGFRNLGALTNNTGGQININRVDGNGQSIGLENESIIPLSNSGIIRIGNMIEAGLYAISNDAPSIFNNNATGELHLDRAYYVGIRNNSTFNNSGLIKVGSLAGGNTMSEGIGSYPTSQYFTNNAGGQIQIDRCDVAFWAGNYSVSTNAGTMTVGELVAVPNFLGANQTGQLKNTVGGVIKTTSYIESGHIQLLGGTLAPGYSPGKMIFSNDEDFTNNICAIEINGTGTPGVNFDQIEVNGDAVIGGTLALTFNYAGNAGDKVDIFIAHTYTGTFTTVTGLAAGWVINYLPTKIILSKGTLTGNYWTGSVSTNWNTAGNWTGGIPDATDDVFIPDVTNNPFLVTSNGLAKSVTIEAGGSLIISSTGVLAINGSNNFGIWNDGSLTNNGTIHIGNTSTVGAYAIENQNTITNTATGVINIDRVGVAGIYAIDGTFNNIGTIVTGALVPAANLLSDAGTGIFNNNANAIFKGTGNIGANRFVNAGGHVTPGYSPGTMTFNTSENFASSILDIEVNGITNPGVNYDKITVTGTATLGGTLALTINYAANPGDQVTILSASSVSGTFSTITGLPANWEVFYQPNAVVLGYGFNFWDGSTSTNWGTASNWSLGLPTANQIVMIPDVTNDPVLSSNNAVAKSVTVLPGGALTILSTGVLTINGATSQGLLNQGTVNNSGTIEIGNTSSVGLKGLSNQGIFTNNASGVININHVSGSQAEGMEQNANTTFTNAGIIRIGNIIQGGQYGFSHDDGTFNNTATGQLYIDRASGPGIRNNSTFNNSGLIKIGSEIGGNTMYNGIGTYPTSEHFTNNAGGQIYIDRCGTAFHCGNYSISYNTGTITIGASVPATMFFDGNQTGKFHNNTGGIIKGTGTISAYRLENNGGTLSPGYSPGKMTIDDSENFTNCFLNIEINGTGTPGITYDQVYLTTGTATIGGTLDLDINYTPANGDQFIIISAPTVTGTFSTITGLLPNWQIMYTSNSVIVKYDTRNTWTGNISTAWSNAGNWTLGVPTASSEVTIPNVTNDPIISTAITVKSVHIQAGTTLTVQAAGSLTTNGTSLYNGVTCGIYNQGTLNTFGLTHAK